MPFVPTAGVVTVLEPGQAITVVNGATGTGTGASFQFTVRPRPDQSAPTLELHAIPTGTFTTLTGTLQASSDGGTTFNTFTGGSNLNFQTTPLQQISNLVAGLIYQVNISGFAGGTSVVINAAIS